MVAGAHEIVYDEQVQAQLAMIDPKHHMLIQQTIEEQLCHQPEKPTRNRKPLRAPAAFGAKWEIRFGPR